MNDDFFAAIIFLTIVVFAIYGVFCAFSNIAAIDEYDIKYDYNFVRE